MVNAVSAGALTPAAALGQRQMLTNGDFETFLRMLTAQLKNQDPLNPMEGSDFAVQLATFSGVEQQAQTNNLLSQLAGQMSGGLGQLSGWLGREVRVTDPVWFADKPLTLDIRPDPRADGVQLVTLSASGHEVMREEIGVGEGEVDWYGQDALGSKLPDGLYMFRLESWQNGELIGESEVGAYAKVVEAQTARDGLQLILEGGAVAMADEVDAMRAAPTE